jgi:uncharacterized protein (TIGR02145 family)
MKVRSLLPAAAVLALCFFAGCKKERELYAPATDIYYQTLIPGTSTATIMAGFSGEEITERGICYGFTNNPTISGPHKKGGSGHGNTTIVLDGLQSNTTYFIKSYATNRGGTNYSNLHSFTTLMAPTLSITSVIGLSTNSAQVVIEVNWNLQSPTGTVGVCYSSTQLPDINSDKSLTGLNSGNFFHRTLTGLEQGKTYTLRAFLQRENEVIYSPVLQLTTFNGTVTDIDGNVYNTVKIGTQEWMVENLKTTKFRNGVQINYVTSAAWPTTGLSSYGHYNNSAVNVPTYGRLYNYQAVASANGLAPEGWHVPTMQEWETLLDFAGPNPGEHLCSNSTGWFSPNSDNRFGFSAVGGGYRDAYGYDNYLQSQAYFWTSDFSGGYTMGLSLNWSYQNFQSFYSSNNVGMSVRCIKD